MLQAKPQVELAELAVAVTLTCLAKGEPTVGGIPIGLLQVQGVMREEATGWEGPLSIIAQTALPETAELTTVAEAAAEQGRELPLPAEPER